MSDKLCDESYYSRERGGLCQRHDPGGINEKEGNRLRLFIDLHQPQWTFLMGVMFDGMINLPRGENSCEI